MATEACCQTLHNEGVNEAQIFEIWLFFAVTIPTLSSHLTHNVQTRTIQWRNNFNKAEKAKLQTEIGPNCFTSY